MRIALIPATPAFVALGGGSAGILIALIAGLPVELAAWLCAAWVLAVTVALALDYGYTLRSWKANTPRLRRRLPAALAIGVRCEVHLALEMPAEPSKSNATSPPPERLRSWRLRLHDYTDPGLAAEGLPVKLEITPGRKTETHYEVTPSRRGEVHFHAADVRIRSRWGLCELIEKLGEPQSRRVYPDFAQVARYAWLAGDRRLAEIGIKTHPRRGAGTDFKQLSEYRVGDSIRQIDWKATLRFGKPIIREYQDERDQCVMLLIDCGRRLRADDRVAGVGHAHFDQVLNAVMLLSYVALKHGDAVGAMTFGTPPGEEKSFAPRKGIHALNGLMAELFAVQPTSAHSDYVDAARTLLSRHVKRSLVILITNFRDEDGSELSSALRLLRTRHLVLLASLREQVVRELISQPLDSADALVEIASAHLYEQSRRDAFNRLAAHDALMVDAEPQRLGIELVNRYHSVKRSGLI